MQDPYLSDPNRQPDPEAQTVGELEPTEKHGAAAPLTARVGWAGCPRRCHSLTLTAGSIRDSAESPVADGVATSFHGHFPRIQYNAQNLYSASSP